MLTASGSGLVYPWSGPNNFTSSSEDITNLFAGSYDLLLLLVVDVNWIQLLL